MYTDVDLYAEVRRAVMVDALVARCGKTAKRWWYAEKTGAEYAEVPTPNSMNLPFLFNDVDDVLRITEGAIGRRLLKGLSRHGLVGLVFFDNGFKQISANRLLLTPTDFRGFRMRVQSSRVIAAQMRALGAARRCRRLRFCKSARNERYDSLSRRERG